MRFQKKTQLPQKCRDSHKNRWLHGFDDCHMTFKITEPVPDSSSAKGSYAEKIRQASNKTSIHGTGEQDNIICSHTAPGKRDFLIINADINN